MESDQVSVCLLEALAGHQAGDVSGTLIRKISNHSREKLRKSSPARAVAFCAEKRKA